MNLKKLLNPGKKSQESVSEKSKNSGSNANSSAGHASGRHHGPSHGAANHASSKGAAGSNTAGSFHPSVETVDVAGIPVNVFGLNNLTPPSQGGVPDVCLSIHMHGRTGSAKNEEGLIKEIYNHTMTARQQLAGSARMRDFLIISFDSRNHGSRKTNPQGQKTWKEGNTLHGYVHRD